MRAAAAPAAAAPAVASSAAAEARRIVVAMVVMVMTVRVVVGGALAVVVLVVDGTTLEAIGHGEAVRGLVDGLDGVVGAAADGVLTGTRARPHLNNNKLSPLRTGGALAGCVSLAGENPAVSHGPNRVVPSRAEPGSEQGEQGAEKGARARDRPGAALQPLS